MVSGDSVITFSYKKYAIGQNLCVYAIFWVRDLIEFCVLGFK